jgi:hypothetical protein
MDRDMLRVAHVPVREEQSGPVIIQAEVDDRSEAGLTAVDLVYRFGGGAWRTEAMAGAGGDLYEATIPGSSEATTVDYYVLARDATGREEGSPRVAPAAWHSFPTAPSTGTPLAARLGAPSAFPNPFTTETRFAFELRFPEHVQLSVHDVSGRRVRRLEDGVRGAGRTELVWDGRDDAGRPVASGVYFYRLQAAGIVYTRPVVLTK